MTVFWLILMVAFIVIEALTVQFFTVWFALGSLFAALASMLGVDLQWQIVCFVAVSVLSLILTRPFVKKLMNNKIEPTNADRCIGKTAVVRQTINNTLNTGQVVIEGGAVWSARSSDGREIAENKTVIINAIEGVKLIVSEFERKESADA